MCGTSLFQSKQIVFGAGFSLFRGQVEAHTKLVGGKGHGLLLHFKHVLGHNTRIII